MCIDCGCGTNTAHHHHHHDHTHDHNHGGDRRTIRVEEDILSKNNRLAGNNRLRVRAHGCRCSICVNDLFAHDCLR